VLGFTSHDHDLAIDGVRYGARPGMTPSAIQHSAEPSADNMEASGLMDSAGLTALDLEAGRWTDARVELFACDWRAPSDGKLRLVYGSLGSIVRTGAGFGDTFRAELLSQLVQLERRKPHRLSPGCRAELGDRHCGVDMRLRRVEVEAAGWNGSEVQLAGALGNPENYAFGRMRWISGPLSGLDRRVSSATATGLLLEEALPELMSAPGRIWLWEGCDKRLATCADRFSNVTAFDGEPHVPGADALVRYGDG
jgi:uncharacterized phage protein (TIGR02218 family)